MGTVFGHTQASKGTLVVSAVTDKSFELCIKKNLPSETTRVSEESDDQQKLSFEEENALRYVGGYVIQKG